MAEFPSKYFKPPSSPPSPSSQPLRLSAPALSSQPLSPRLTPYSTPALLPAPPPSAPPSGSSASFPSSPSALSLQPLYPLPSCPSAPTHRPRTELCGITFLFLRGYPPKASCEELKKILGASSIILSLVIHRMCTMGRCGPFAGGKAAVGRCGVGLLRAWGRGSSFCVCVCVGLYICMCVCVNE